MAGQLPPGSSWQQAGANVPQLGGRGDAQAGAGQLGFGLSGYPGLTNSLQVAYQAAGLVGSQLQQAQAQAYAAQQQQALQVLQQQLVQQQQQQQAQQAQQQADSAAMQRLAGLSASGSLTQFRALNQGPQTAVLAQQQLLQQALAQNPLLQAQFAQTLQVQQQLASNAQQGQQGLAGQALRGSLQQPSINIVQRSAATAPGGTLQQQQQQQQQAALNRQVSKPQQPPAAPAARLPSTGQPAAQQQAPPRPPSAAGGSVARVAEAAPAARRTTQKKRKAPERPPAAHVVHSLPESELFTALAEQQRAIDALAARRRAQLADALKTQERLPKRLRVYLHASRTDPATRDAAEPPSWTLHIYGKVVDVAEALAPPQQQQQQQQLAPGQAAPPPRPQRGVVHPMTHYLRRVQVQLDSEQYPGQEGRVVWTREGHQGDHKDSVEIRRRGARGVKVNVSFEMESLAERFTLAPPLAALVGTATDTRPRVLHAVWTYIKQHKLYSSAQAGTIECDARLQAVLGQRTVPLAGLAARLAPLLRPLAPVEMEYTIPAEAAGLVAAPAACYDIDIEVPAGWQDDRLAPFLDRLAKDREIEAVDAKLTSLLRKIEEHRRRRAFFAGFAHSPVDFINALVASQARDLRVIKERESAELEAVPPSSHFRGRWVEDAVLRYLHRRLAAGG